MKAVNSKKGYQKRRGKERVENKYKEKSVTERKSIVEYFSKHPAFGSTDWYDTDETIKGRNLSDGKKCGAIANSDAPFRCTECKRAWHHVGTNKPNQKTMYLAPSVWKSLPLSEKICHYCKQYLEKEGEMWTEDYE